MVSKTFSFPHSNFIGFDHLWNEIERLSLHSDQSFPKHNVVKNSETEFAIELALAGYRKEDITVELKEGILVVSGDQSKDDKVEYLHKGISTKKFTRSFRLSEHVVVDGADFVDGLLVIDLKVVIPEEKRPRIIPIGGDKQLLLED
jgi:molecular chaperone IbpA